MVESMSGSSNCGSLPVLSRRVGSSPGSSTRSPAGRHCRTSVFVQLPRTAPSAARSSCAPANWMTQARSAGSTRIDPSPLPWGNSRRTCCHWPIVSPVPTEVSSRYPPSRYGNRRKVGPLRTRHAGTAQVIEQVCLGIVVMAQEILFRRGRGENGMLPFARG